MFELILQVVIEFENIFIAVTEESQELLFALADISDCGLQGFSWEIKFE